VRAVLPAAVTAPIAVVAPSFVLPVVGRFVDIGTAAGVVVGLLANWLIPSNENGRRWTADHSPSPS